MSLIAKSEKRSDDATEAIIDQTYEAKLEYYYNTDLTIAKTDDMLHNAVFRNEWLVRWGDTFIMAYFKIPVVRRALVRQLREMRALRRMKRYFCVYVYKDLGKWMKAFHESLVFTNGVPADALVLPCGIVRSDMGRFKEIAPRGVHSIERVLQFEPVSEELADIYDFHVYNAGARFYDVTNSQNRNLHGLENAPQGMLQSVFMAASSNSHLLRPVSEFAELYEMRRKLEEAETYMFNAANAAAFPLAYMTANALPQEPVEEITDDVLATAKDMHDARTKGRALTTMKVTVPRALAIAKTIASTMSAATGKPVSAFDVASATPEGDDTARKAIANAYGRVDPSQNLVPIPDFITINSAHPPTSLIDVAQLRMQYEVAVCRCMDVPYSFYRTELETTGHTSGASNMVLSESIINAAIADEQKVYAELFDWLYMNTFAALDKASFADMAAEYDAMDDARANSESTRRVIKFITDMIERGDSYAKLEFELLTATNAESLAAMVQAQQLQLVPRLLLERNAQRLFGHTLGASSDKYVLQGNPALRTNLNAPLMDPATSADVTATKAKATADSAARPAKRAKKE
jgi:hypothetical protein